MAKKLTKEETDYSSGMQNSHCGPVFLNDKGYCAHYNGNPGSSVNGTCDVVEGPINPVYWCNHFKKAKE